MLSPYIIQIQIKLIKFEIYKSMNLVPQIFSLVLPLLDVMHCCKLSFIQFQGKLMGQTWENDKKT